MKKTTQLVNQIAKLGFFVRNRNPVMTVDNLAHARNYLATRDPKRALKVSDTWLATLVVVDQFDLSALSAAHTRDGACIVAGEAIRSLLKADSIPGAFDAMDFAQQRYDSWAKVIDSPLSELYAKRGRTIRWLARICFP